MHQQNDDVYTTALSIVTKSLKPFFKGKNSEERLQNASEVAVSSIHHLLNVNENVRRKPIGATIMTPGAASNLGVSPRIL